MSFRTWVSFAVVCVISFCVGVLVSAQEDRLRDQARRKLLAIQGQPGEAQVLSGNDIGFRLDGSQANGPRGTLVVRVNGKWVEAHFVMKPNPVSTR